MKLSVKKGDFVKIIAGQDKGKTGQILSVDTDKGRVVVEGKDIAHAKKAVKARKASDKSGIITIPKSIDVSNVMPVCAECGKATRVKHAIVDGKKVRVCKCGAVLETKKIKDDKKAKATVRKKAKKTDVVETAADTAIDSSVEAALGVAPSVSELEAPAENKLDI